MCSKYLNLSRNFRIYLLILFILRSAVCVDDKFHCKIYDKRIKITEKRKYHQDIIKCNRKMFHKVQYTFLTAANSKQ